MSAQGIRAGKAYVEYNAKDNMTRGLVGIKARIRDFGTKLRSAILPAVGAVTALGAAFAKSLKTFADFGDQIDKMSKRTGVSTVALSELAFAAEQSGSSITSVERGIRGMQRFLLEASRGSQEAEDTLRDLGITLTSIVGKRPDEQFMILARALERIEDPSTKAALAMKAFGKSGAELLPLIEEGAEGIETLRTQAKLFGKTITEDMAKDAALLTDTLNEMNTSLQGLQIQLAKTFAPAATKGLKNLSEWAVVFRHVFTGGLGASWHEAIAEIEAAEEAARRAKYVGPKPGKGRFREKQEPIITPAPFTDATKALPNNIYDSLEGGAKSISTAINESTKWMADSIKKAIRTGERLFPALAATESRGIFHAAAIQTLQGGAADKQTQILDVNKQMLHIQRKIERAMYDLGLSFK